MYPQQIHNYVTRFFEENNCPILSDQDNFIIVQLTIDMDKKIMNRPFYWKYLESTGEEPKPAQLTFITDRNKLAETIKGEVIHFGSPRLHQLFQVTKELGSFVRMFEQVHRHSTTQIILTPWFGVNYKVAYYSDRTKEMLYSLGVNLITGEVRDGFHETLLSKDLSEFAPENTFQLPYTIKPIRALERLDALIEKSIHQDDHTWAEEAKMRWKKDRQILEFFYEGVENRPDSYEIEKEAMDQQYETKIKVDIVNGGLFYLK